MALEIRLFVIQLLYLLPLPCVRQSPCHRIKLPVTFGQFLSFCCELILRSFAWMTFPFLFVFCIRIAGFAFCDFQTKAMADECVRNMDGLKLENLAITVEIARRSAFVHLEV